MTDDSLLLESLERIRARGAIGESSLTTAVAHADRFTVLVPDRAATLVDLGSGGGLPGLVIAWRRPDLRVTLVDRRATRADLLRRAVRALGVDARVEVVVADVRAFGTAHPRHFDVVTARSFGSPVITARCAAPLVRPPSGVVLVSEPPDPTPDRWPPALLAELGLGDDGLHDGVRRLRCA
ncbi:MAG: rsmG [Ilumatobacteraceae bacterium]|nr:rsmG [Ilumatobacteraceae bacterium]